MEKNAASAGGCDQRHPLPRVAPLYPAKPHNAAVRVTGDNGAVALNHDRVLFVRVSVWPRVKRRGFFFSRRCCDQSAGSGPVAIDATRHEHVFNDVDDALLLAPGKF